MSLLIGIAYKDQFALMSGDTKVTIEEHDAFTFEKMEEMGTRDAGISNDKVTKISDFVMLSTLGVVETGDVLEEELKKHIKPEYTLDKCAEVLQEVTRDLWNKKVDWDEGGENNKDLVSLNFLGTKHFTCYMFGFYSNGKTGLAYIDPEDILVHQQEAPDPGMACVIISPDEEDNRRYMNWLNIPEEEQSLDNISQQVLLLHGKLSREHSHSVSSDCHMHLLVKNEDKLLYYQDTNDTSALYPMFEENPDIDHRKTWKIYKHN